MRIKQGETKSFVFYSYEAGSTTPILDEPADIVFTAVKEDDCCNSHRISKKLGAGISFDTETGQYTLSFEPSDTINLPAGNYPFDIKIKRGNAQYFIVKQGAMNIDRAYTGVI